MRLTPNFTLEEFLPKGLKPDGTQYTVKDVPPDVLENLNELAGWLQFYRSQHGRRIFITSGYRPPEYNARVGGVPNSMHILGKAADFVEEGQTPAQTQNNFTDWPGGVGNAKDFTHADLGEFRRWNY